MNPNKTYLQTKKETVKTREGEYLGKQSNPDLLMAVAAVVVEGVIGFLLTLPAGLPIASASAIFPVMVNLVIAKVQSDRFDVPEASERLLNDYERDLHPPEIPAIEALKIERIQALVQYISSPRPSRNIRSASQAQAVAQMNFSQLITKKIEGEGIEIISKVEQDHEQAVENVPNRVPVPDINFTRMTAEQAEKAKTEWMKDWIRSEIERLNKKHVANIERVSADVGQAISYWKEIYSQGEKEYQNDEE